MSVEQLQVTAGYRLVPAEATINMIAAASRKMKEIPQHHFHEHRAGIAADIWGWMLDAAPGGEAMAKEAVAELDGLLAAWANKHCAVNFWTVSNVKKVTVTTELAAEYNDDAIGA